MKKTIYYSMIILAGLYFTAACSKDKPVVTNNQEEESVGITLPETISVAIPDNLTRVSLTQDDDADGAVKLAWDEDDKIYVAESDHNETWTTYEIDTPLGENPHVATFHRVGDEITASSFDIFYGAPSIAIAEGIDFSEQTQEGNANTDHLQYMALISGVNTVENVQFTSDWAAENGGSFKQSGIIRLRLQMPSGVTAVSSVFLEASSAVFSTTNKLDGKTDMIKVDFSSDVDISSDHIVTVYANLPWEDVSVSAGVGLTVVVKTSDGYYYSKEISNASGLAFSTGSVNAVKLNRSGFNLFAGGSGADGNPYTIASKWHLMNTKPCTDAADDGSVTYFKLLNDIDMSGRTWEMLNPTSPYDKLISFDGNNKTISSLGKSLFYVLKGSVSDLTLDGCQVSTRGILSEYIQGTGNVVSDVTVSNGKVNTSNNNAGALIGTINSGSGTCATISDCTASNTDVTGVGVVGGLIGFADQLVQISGCSFIGGTVTASARYAGGLLGSTGNYNSVISDCHVENTTISITVSNNDFRAGGLIGQLQTKVQVKGCSVGKSGENVILNLSAPTSGKVYNAGGFVGVGYGTITKKGDVRSASYVTINAGNEVGNAQLNLGGFVGYNTGKIEYSDANVSASSVVGSHIGGFAGYALQNSTIENCTATGAVSGTQKTGGFVGVAENGSVNECLATTVVSKFGSATGSGEGTDFGGFVGIVTQTATLIKCSSDADIEINTNYVGGFAGSINPAADKTAKISKCWSKGNVKSNAAQCGGFIGHIAANATGTVLVEDCYTVGSLIETNQRQGGLIGQINSGVVTVNRCYAAGTISGSFAIGGLIGFMNSTATITNCAAWNATVTPKTYGDGNWSSGAVIGVAWPVATLSNNYRKSDMSLTAWWVPDADYNHPDVSSPSPLIVKDKTDGTLRPTTATSAASGQDNYPQFAFHGKVEDGKTLTQLASTTLGWSSDVWDFTGELPTLK